MKKITVIMLVLFAFATTTFAAADSTKTAKVKELSTKEYTIIADGDTSKVLPGDTISQTRFVEADSVKFTGRTDTQMIKGTPTKVKEITANGKTGWVKADQDLSEPIEMWCDEDETSDPIGLGWYGLMGLVIVAAGFLIWRFGFRG